MQKISNTVLSSTSRQTSVVTVVC